MGLTYNQVPGIEGVSGTIREKFYDVTADDDYPSGGYTLYPQDSGLFVIAGVETVGGNSASASFDAMLNIDTGNLEFFGSGGGEVSYNPGGGGGVLGSTNIAAAAANADQAAAPVNSILLVAQSTFTLFAGTMTATANPDVPRNVLITIENATGGPLNLYEGITTFLVTGTDTDGVAQTESITLTSTAGNKAVADTKFRFVQGSKIFKTVVDVTITNAPAGALGGSVGIGSRIGLPSDLLTPAYTDVTSATVNATPLTIGSTVTTAGGVDTTNMAVNVGTIADGDDIVIDYNSAASEVLDGADLSDVTKRLRFIGV